MEISGTKRLFLAIRIQPDQRFLSIYTDLQNRLRHEKIRWVSPGHLHITLKFFGEISVEKIDAVNRSVNNIVINFTPFTIILQNIAIFGSSYKPRVIWFGIEENKQLIALTNEITAALGSIGFPADRQNFVPHLTIGRMRSVRNKREFQEAIASFREVFVQKSEINEIILFESKLRPAGPAYFEIEKYTLN